jgi:hypothetical protein
MGHLYIPGEKQIVGPWLLDLKDLEELHEIFEFVDSTILESISLDINDEAERDVKNGYSKTLEEAKNKIVKRQSKRHKRVTLISHDEKILFDSTIAGLLKDPKLVGFKPRELKLSIRDAHYRNEFKLDVSNRFDGQLDYRVKCSHQDAEDEIKYKVENWLDKNEPSKPKQWWTQYSFLAILICSMICGGSITQIVRTEKIDVKEKYRTEIKQLLDSGVNEANRNKSIELLLKYTTEYETEDQATTKTTNKTALRIFLSSLFVILISVFKPKTTIGVGANKGLVKFYRAYSYFIFVTIPGIFIAPPLIDWIRNLW